MQVAMTYSRIRTEERLLIEAFEHLNATVIPIDLRECVINPTNRGIWGEVDAVFDRSLSLTHSLTSIRMLEIFGIPCINGSAAIQVCSDKLQTSLALIRNGIPTPEIRVALTAESGLEAIEELGYPAVIKPTVGSWGRLVARVNDRDAAEAILEHRETLGSVQQRVIYVQEHIDKPNRDIRVFVVGGRAIAAIARSSEHWVTNTARGARAEGLTLTDELASLSVRAVESVGADIAAVDFLECPTRGLLVNEINHSMEFRNSIDTTGVDIARHIAQHVIERARAGVNRAAVLA
jgi:[lysine-biosynthesis-protein LysW]---L-2-aminoadipate ligase